MYVYIYIYVYIDILMYTVLSGQCGTGWRRPTGCHQSQVIFRNRATNYRSLLRKMTYKDKASYGSSPPCICRAEINPRGEFSTQKKWLTPGQRENGREKKLLVNIILRFNVPQISHTYCTYATKGANTQKWRALERNVQREVGGWGRVPFSRNLMSPSPRRKWYLTTGRRAH